MVTAWIVGVSRWQRWHGGEGQVKRQSKKETDDPGSLGGNNYDLSSASEGTCRPIFEICAESQIIMVELVKGAVPSWSVWYFFGIHNWENSSLPLRSCSNHTQSLWSFQSEILFNTMAKNNSWNWGGLIPLQILALTDLRFQMYLHIKDLNKVKKPGGTLYAIIWNKKSSLGKMFIFITLTLPNHEWASWVHLCRSEKVELSKGI